jgi:serine protease Do
VLLEFDDQPIHSPADLAELVGLAPVGRSASLHLVRDGQSMDLSIDVDRRDVSRVSWMRGSAVLWRGLRVSELTPESRARMGASDAAAGVIVTDVVRNSPAAQARLEIGDVIQAIDNQPIQSISAFRRRVSELHGRTTLGIRGKGARVIQP